MSLQSLSRAWSRRLEVAALAPLLVLFSACGHEKKSHPDITVYAAASMTDALGEIAKAWRAESGVGVTFSFGATSKLVPQIKEGAPADALVSADEAWMDKLVEAGNADTASRVIIARNELVFIVPAGAAKVPASSADLPGDLQLIALAGENVPAGTYAKTSLEKADVWAAVQPRVRRAAKTCGGAQVGVERRGRRWRRLPDGRAGGCEGEDRVPVPVRQPCADRLPGRGGQGSGAGGGGRSIPRVLPEHHGTSDLREVRLPAARPVMEMIATAGPLRLSLGVAIWAMLVAAPFAIAFGWLLARRQFPGKAIVSTIVYAPLVLPPGRHRLLAAQAPRTA